MTNESEVDYFIEKVKDTIKEAQKDLLDVKIVREYDPTDYSHVIQQLSELDEEGQVYLSNPDPEIRRKVAEARKYIEQTQEMMTRGI